MLVLTLLFLGVVGLRRTWDLRGYTGGALALLSGRNRAYGYFHTERLLSQMARMNQAEPLTNALAAWTTQLWHPPEQQPLGNSTAYYIDGHRKPVYTERLIPRGLVGRLRTVLGCRTLEDLTLHERAMYELDNRKDQVMTVFKVALTNLVMWTRDHYFPVGFAHATWQRLAPFFHLPGLIVQGPTTVRVELRPFNDRQFNRDLVKLC